MKKKVLIVGPILTQSGYGEHSRFVYRILKSREDLFDIYVKPIKWGNTSWMWEDNDERKELDKIIGKTQLYMHNKGPLDICLMVTIPSEWKMYRSAPINIGVTAAVETSKAASTWIEACNQFVDKIIVTSEFTKEVLERSVYHGKDSQTNQEVILKVETPIIPVNYPVKEYNKADLDLNLDYDFNFLTVVQWSPRKNVENTISWFVEEFIDQEVGLVLKMNIAANSILDKTRAENNLKNLLQKYPNRKCKVYLLHGYMTHDEMHSLYVHPKIKALLSLTHGEGFGLPLFEAAYCGLPVITHDWGGQKDFLVADEKDKKGKIKKRKFYVHVESEIKPVQKEAVWEGVILEDSMWAFPKQGSVKMRMREVYKHHNRFKGRAKKLQKILLKTHAKEKMYKIFLDELKEYSSFDNQIEELFNEIAV
jgi:glycosyltransferase involved in cell wall biosynthesis